MSEVKESKDFVKLLLLIRQLYVEWDQKIRNYFNILKGTEETHSDRTSINCEKHETGNEIHFQSFFSDYSFTLLYNTTLHCPLSRVKNIR